MAEAADLDAVADADAGAEKDGRLHSDVAPETGVRREPDRRGVDESGAGGHGSAAQALLHDALDQRQVGARIHAEHLLGRALDDAGRPALGVGQGEDVGEVVLALRIVAAKPLDRSEEHTSELQSLMRISYAVLCLKKKKKTKVLPKTVTCSTIKSTTLTPLSIIYALK